VSYFNGDGTLSWWYLQKDVLLFQCQNGEEYSGYLDTFVVEDMNYYYEEASQFNELLLNSNSTLADLIVLKDSIIASGQLRMFAPVLTRFPYDANIQQRYYRTDDQLLITFHDPTIDSITIQNFMDEYHLRLVHKPSSALSSSASWGYVFRLDLRSDTILNTILMANVIATYEPNLVKIVTPNIIGGNNWGCDVVSEMNISPGGSNGTWHIRNQGQVIFSGYSGVNDADADICECWGEGYTGDGIKIGIIDVGGFESDHPDFTPFGEGYNAFTSQLIPANSNTYSTYNHHGMAVSGVIGATPNNTNLGQRFAAGVAYDASLHPFLVNLNSAHVLVALQRCVQLNMDVVNMSFRIPFSSNVSDQITNMATTTRYVNGQFRGMVLVAATGNNDLEAFNFPANHANVIGVGMSNPDDNRSRYDVLSNSWGIAPDEGSTYGPPTYNYDVVSPGTIIMTLDLKGANGDDTGDYLFGKGTSFSSPIVAGIASMLLQKNPNLSYTEVRDLIRNGADKVRPATYNYNMFPGFPGYNNEMFYGRVSCINSLNQVLDIEQKTLQKLTIQHISENDYVLILPHSQDFQNVKIVNALGQIVWDKKINPNEYQLEFSLEAFSSGLFFLNLYEGTQLIGNQKLVR